MSLNKDKRLRRIRELIILTNDLTILYGLLLIIPKNIVKKLIQTEKNEKVIRAYEWGNKCMELENMEQLIF